MKNVNVLKRARERISQMLGLTSRNKWKGRVCGALALCVWISALPITAANADPGLHV